MKRHIRPSYRGDGSQPPERRLLAAVLKRAVLDLHSASPRQRAAAREFLAAEGAAWLPAFGIPERKVLSLLEGESGSG